MQTTKGELPLMLTVHFQSFPTNKLLRCKTIFTVRNHYLNAFKEALFLKYGSSKLVQNLTLAETTGLWDSLTNNRFDDFYGIRNKIMKKGESENERRTSETDKDKVDAVQFLPIRIYVSGFGTGESRFECKCIQQPIPPRLDGKVQTLETLFKTIVPGVVYDMDGALNQDVEIIIQGVNPPMNTELAWLCEHMCHPDQFLYVSVICHAS